MFHVKIHTEEKQSVSNKVSRSKQRFQLADHPWLSLAALWCSGILVFILVAAAANLVGVPGDAPYRPLITPTLAHIIVLFIITPFVFQLPNGRTTFRKYLFDIRLSRVQPFFPLLILGVSSSVILLLFLAANSLIYRIIQGFPINPTFLRNVIDLRVDLPPHSLSYVNSFPAIFEEVLWRGIMMFVFLRRYSAKQSIIMTAFGFGLFHFINLLGDVEPSFVIQQVILGSALGLFYGYLVLRTNSLMPAMLFHYLVNMFIGSFIRYMAYAPYEIKTAYLALNLLVSVPLLILWVKFFSKRWIPKAMGFQSITLWR